MTADPATVLRERAAALARPPVDGSADAAGPTVVTFAVAGEVFALEARYVREVTPAADVVPVPAAPAVLAGVTNLRGEILALFDARPLLGLKAAEGGRAVVLVIGEGRAEFGLLADEALEVTVLRPSELHAPPAPSGGGLVKAVTPAAVALLDGAALLADPRLTIDQSDDAEGA